MQPQRGFAYPITPRGRFFFIKSQLTDHVMTVKIKNTPGTPIILWPNKSKSNPAQMFYEDFDTGTIRSMLNDWCLEGKGTDLTVAPYAEGNSNQKWQIAQPVIHNHFNADKVLDVLKASREVGAKVGCWTHTGAKNQQWTIEPAPPQYFVLEQRYLRLRMRVGEKEDLDGYFLAFRDDSEPVTSADLWYLDAFGVLRSKLGGLALDGSGGASPATSSMSAKPYSAATYLQQWVYRDKLLYNRHVSRLVVTVQEFDYGEIGVFCRENKGADVQLWDVEYLLPREVAAAEERED